MELNKFPGGNTPRPPFREGNDPPPARPSAAVATQPIVWVEVSSSTACPYCPPSRNPGSALGPGWQCPLLWSWGQLSVQAAPVFMQTQNLGLIKVNRFSFFWKLPTPQKVALAEYYKTKRINFILACVRKENAEHSTLALCGSDEIHWHRVIITNFGILVEASNMTSDLRNFWHCFWT